MTEIIASMGVYDYGKNKLCDLYDSQNNLRGQAYNISFKQSMADGIHTLTFSIPYMVDGEENFRWDYLKNEYLIRLKFNGQVMWYIATKPVKSKSGKEVIGTVTCQGLEALLKTRNIYMEFDDTNGIGTVDELTDKVLAGTGWHRGYTDPMLEADGETEKVRSITSGGKDGALGLMSKISNVFKCFPVYDSENMTVALYNFNNREQVLEGVVGYNLNALTVTPDSASMITRMYVEGEYGDNGYVGIDDVNPTGLSYLMNFDYYREIGVMTDAQEQALNQYISDISAAKGNISRNAALIIDAEDEINNLIGQCNVSLYYTSIGFDNEGYFYGNPTDAQKALSPGSKVLVLNENGTYRTEIVEMTPQALIQSGDYGIAKFGTPAAGLIGGKEVQVEAKEKQIASLRDKIGKTTKEDKIASYNEEIAVLEAGIEDLYIAEEDGLYVLMDTLFRHGGLIETLHDLMETSSGYGIIQDNIESEFIMAMGPLLRDGYWSNQNYVPGQEAALYADATEVMKEMSRPATSYTFDFVRIMDDFGIPMEDIRLNAIFRIHDDELKIHENLFITDIIIGVDDLSNGSIEVSNRDITINTNDLGALLSRMSQLSDLIEQKNTLYERAKAISKNGTLYADRLNGQIDVLKNQIISTVSNWHTDENGNILFEAADGGSAMMLSGAGFMITNQKDENGEWVWRTFGSGEGFTADEIIAGFLSADRIEAGSISTAKVTPDFGDTLVIANNPTISGIEAQIEVLPNEIVATVKKYGRTYIQLTDPVLDEDKLISVGDFWMIGDPDGEFTWGDAGAFTHYDLLQIHNLGTMAGYKDIFCWDGEKWVYIFDTALSGETFARVSITEAKLETEVARQNALEGKVASQLSQTAEKIETEVSRATAAEGRLASRIQQTADSITTEVTRLSEADEELGTRIQQTADGITLGTIAAGAVQTQGDYISISGSGITMDTGSSLSITGGSISLVSGTTFTVTGNNFSIDDEGNVEMTGDVYAEGGTIGGFTIKDTYLGTNKKAGYASETAGVYIGNDGIGLGAGTFYVDSSGFLYAGNAQISGTIYAGAGGTIGGFNINSTSISTQSKGSPSSGAGVFVGTTGIGVGTNFYVGTDGVLHATGASISGTLTANNGSSIGNWNVGPSGYAGMLVGNGTWPIVLNPNARTGAGSVVLGNMAFVSGTSTVSESEFNSNYGIVWISKGATIGCAELQYTNLYDRKSSRTTKHDIHSIDSCGELLDKLDPVSFVYNFDPNSETHFGFIYEDLVKVIPGICKIGDAGVGTISMIQLIPFLAKEIKDLRKRVADLEAKE